MPEQSIPSIESQLRPDEKILWQGKPAHEAGTPVAKSNPLVRITVVLAFFGVAAWILSAKMPEGTLERLTGGQLPPGAMIGIAAAVIIMFVLPQILKAFKVDPQARLDRYLFSQAYAITDQRIIIVSEGNVQSYGPEHLVKLSVKDLGTGKSDVRFYRRSRSRGSSGNRSTSSDPVEMQREWIGFKMLPDAEAVKQRLEQWIAERVSEAAEGIEDFSADESGSGQEFRNTTLGIAFRVPDDWDVQVRKKTEPHGKTFVDKEHWRAIGETDDWNTVRVTGPLNCEVLFELFETEPTVTLESMTKGFLVKMLVGKPTETDLDYDLNGMPGFALTYGKDLLMEKAQKKGGGGGSVNAVQSKVHVLHDGRRQLYVASRWPKSSPDLGKAVDAVVQSIRVD